MFSLNNLQKHVGNLFLRNYAGVLAALCISLLVIFLLTSLINKVRFEAYTHKLLEGLFSGLLLDFSLTEDKQNLTKDQLEQWLDSANQQLNIVLSLKSLADLQLEPRQLERLQQGRFLLEIKQQIIYIYVPAPVAGQVLVTHFTRINEQHLTSSLILIQRHLQGLSLEEQQLVIQKLSQKLNYPMQLVNQLPLHTDKKQKASLARGEPALYMLPKQGEITGLLQLQENTWLKLGAIKLFNPYPVYLLIFLGCLALAVLAATLSWFLFSLEKRLRALERASTQLASGNLRARVQISGNDFVTRLSLAYNRMAEQLQRLLSTQQEMIHAVSHELRTPLARMRFSLQILEDYYEDLHENSSNPKISKHFQGLDQDIEELNTLIDETLTYARLGQEELQLEFVQQDALDLTQEVVENFQRSFVLNNPEQNSPAPISLKLEIHNPDNLSTQADLEAKYFQRALQNLIGNALRYAHSQVKLSLLVETESLRLDIEDDGPGIPADFNAKVFAPFARLDDSRTRSSGGYGLGLSIVQRIMFWHKGSALVETSSSLKGAKFSLVFPRHQVVKLTQLKG